MSLDIRYRLFLNNEPASREELEQIEDITVEQEIGMAWEARLEVQVCLGADGRWSNIDRDSVLKRARRVRLEVSMETGRPFVPLIDGPVADITNSMSSQPGESSATIIVRDDSHLLDRQVRNFNLDDRSDRQRVIELFTIDDVVEESRLLIDDGVSTESGSDLAFRFKGSAISALYCLARRYGMHVNVLPGEEPGESRGCFRHYPGEHDENEGEPLPDMVLVGSDANITKLRTRKAQNRPATFESLTLRVGDKEPLPARTDFRDRELLGDHEALEEGEEERTEIVDPSPCVATDPERAARAGAEGSSYAFEAEGSIIQGCYRGVLLPYWLVMVRLGASPKSARYIVRQVTHTLTRSGYSQSFSLLTNAYSEIEPEAVTSAIEKIF